MRDVAEVVQEQFDAQLDALRQLVDQPSFTTALDDVEAASALLDRFARAAELDVEAVASTGDFADHRVYATPGLGDAPALALVGHIDTVHPRSSGFLAYSAEGDVARGPGVLDMKSGLTCMLFALSAARQAGHDVAARIFCVSDEEVGSPTSRDLYAARRAQLTQALVFEKGRDEDRIVTSRKGGGTFRVTARGVAAHAGNSHAEGVNAVHALALLVPKIEAITDYARGITLNVGVFEGGTSKNTVPEHASVTIDARFVEAATVDEVVAKLHEVLATPMPPRLAAVQFALSGGVSRPPMERTAEIEALRFEYEAAALAAGLNVGEAPRQGGFSDANLLAALGVPTIDGLGPYGDGAHSTAEWCSIDSLRRRTEALARFLALRAAA